MERVLRRDLLRDYTESTEFLASKHGRGIPLPTSRAFYHGQFGFECRFEDFTVDTPLNRVLKGAAVAVLASPLLRRAIRRRAQALRTRMELVGEYKRDDILVGLDRRTHYYEDALQLARHILRNQGRALAQGEAASWTFLIRTPEMVEDGLRKVIQRILGNSVSVSKKGKQLNTGLTFTPDLVFDQGSAVADIKYKLLRPDWLRSDLYQIVAFGTAFSTDDVAVIGFKSTIEARTPEPQRIGNMNVHCFGWPADPVRSKNSCGLAMVVLE